MLELSQVITEIGKMGSEARRRDDRTEQQTRIALRQARMHPDTWGEATARRALTAKPNWPVADCPIAPGEVVSVPLPTPVVYTALATDGSQIPLDRHASAPCYLLNVGEIALHYGTGERPRLSSHATLHYKDEEIYQNGSDGGGGSAVSEAAIALRRLLAESAALAALIAENHERTALALSDGPLILVFADQRESTGQQREVVQEFCEMLRAAQTARTPMAGYVSRPGARDVVGTLRLTLCDPGCTHEAGGLCAALAHLTDAQLFAHLLKAPGDRSLVFGSQARSLALYPEDQRIQFFYLNVGPPHCPEVARIEVPRWVSEDQELLDRVQVLCYDQACKGQGYPIALMEAHERAIVRGPERDAFLRLVESAFVRESLPALQTRKSVSKRMRVL